MKRLAALAFATLIPLPFVACQSSGDTVAVITKLENDGIKADLASDPGWVQQYLADDWIGYDSSGDANSKQDVLRIMANTHYTNETLSDLKVRVYGNTAVATYKTTYNAQINGGQRVRSTINTDIWVKIGSDWKQVAWQGTATK